MQTMSKEDGYRRILWKMYAKDSDSGFYTGQVQQYPVSQVLMHAMDDAMNTLRLREAFVLRYSSGLEDGQEHSLAETGRHLVNQTTGRRGLTGARAQQIASKALRKLRHPSRSRSIVAAMEDRSIVPDSYLRILGYSAD